MEPQVSSEIEPEDFKKQVKVVLHRIVKKIKALSLVVLDWLPVLLVIVALGMYQTKFNPNAHNSRMSEKEARTIFGYGLFEKIDPDELKKRYIQKSKGVHPDLGGSDEQFDKLVRAYERLGGSNRG